MCLPHVSPKFKKISPKTFGPHCVNVRVLKNATNFVKFHFERKLLRHAEIKALQEPERKTSLQ
jgi:hypothetical protein